MDIDDIVTRVFQVFMTLSLTAICLAASMLFNQEANHLLRIVLLFWVGIMYVGLLFILWMMP